MRPKLKRRETLPSVSIETIFPPTLFRTILGLCCEAIACSNNHRNVRDKVIALRLSLIDNALSEFGHPTPEVTLLYDLLKRTDERSKRPRNVPNLIEELVKRRDFSPEQMDAARQIMSIWRAFSRFLSVAARNYNAGNSRRSVALEPLDMMSDEEVLIWNDRYRPWREKATRRRAPSSRPYFISGAALVIHALATQETSEVLDMQFGLVKGESVRVLREELTAFNDLSYIPTYSGAIRAKLDRVFDPVRVENPATPVAV